MVRGRGGPCWPSRTRGRDGWVYWDAMWPGWPQRKQVGGSGTPYSCGRSHYSVGMHARGGAKGSSSGGVNRIRAGRSRGAGGRSGWGSGRTSSIALRGRARPSLIGCHQASGRAARGIASGRTLSALGSAGGLAGGEKGHVFIAGVDLERIGRRLLRLLVEVDQGGFSDRLSRRGGRAWGHSS